MAYLANIKTSHSYLLTLGTILWVAGFFLAVGRIYPWAYLGAFLGAPLVLVGIAVWVIHYRKMRGFFPSIWRSFSKVLQRHSGITKYHFAIFDFLFTYLLHFWMVCIVFWIMLVSMASFGIRSTDNFERARRYVEQDYSLKERIGEVAYFGLLVSGHQRSNGDAELNFTIIGENGQVDAKAKFERSELIKMQYHQ